jgi:hypothetical protein
LLSLALSCGGCGSEGDHDSSANSDIQETLDATVESNPICTLSCIVHWETDEPATSWVEFGEGGSLTHTIGSDFLSKDHEVIVVGMHADTSHQLRAVSQTEQGIELRSPLFSFETGSVPGDYMKGVVDVHNEALAQNGWTLANLVHGGVFGFGAPIRVAIYDMEGRVVWYYEQNPPQFARADIQVSLVDGDRILVGPGVPDGHKMFEMDLAGNVVWEGYEQPGMRDGGYHHVLYRLENGDYVTSQIEEREGVGGDLIIRFDRDLNAVWSWNAWDHLTYTPGIGGFMGDWTHLNSAHIDLENDVAYINSWHLSALYKVSCTDGSLLWTFGEGGDFAADPLARQPWFGPAHSFDYLGNGVFLAYDNGRPPRYSRAVKYHLDENTMQSTLLWEYAGDNAWDRFFGPSLGDADQLQNGNVLITAGNSAQLGSPTRLIEVTPAKEKVWQLWFQPRVSVYQSERIEPLARSLE